MKYTVIRHFTDLQDNNYKYKEGMTYPREGYVPSEHRILELAGSENKQRTPLISANDAEENIEAGTGEETDAEYEADEEPVEKQPKKRNRKKSEE